MAKKKTNPKLVSKGKGKKKSSARSAGTARGNKVRNYGHRQYGQYLRENGNILNPTRVRKNFFKSEEGQRRLSEIVAPDKNNEDKLRVPGKKYAPRWLNEALRAAMRAVVKANHDRLFGENGLLKKAMQNTNGKQKSIGDGFVYVNMNKDGDIRRSIAENGLKDLRINAEAINAFNEFAKSHKTFTDATGRKIAVPTTMADIKKTLTKMLYMIPFGPDGKTF